MRRRAGTPLDFAVGACAASAIAVAALRARALDRTGAVAAIAVGTLTYGSLGLPGAGVLVAFFVSSVALSRFGRSEKAAKLVDVDKTGARDGMQVLANGGVAALCALASLSDARFVPAFAGAFAAATADTWATEIGTLAKQEPRSILTFERIATGLSGGITFAGTIAEIAGAVSIAIVAAVAFRLRPRAIAGIAVAGVVGALVDSLLGASLQSLRWCGACKRATERQPHACGVATKPIRGVTWFGNDAVNFSATACGAAVAGVLAENSLR